MHWLLRRTGSLYGWSHFKIRISFKLRADGVKIHFNYIINKLKKKKNLFQSTIFEGEFYDFLYTFFPSNIILSSFKLHKIFFYDTYFQGQFWNEHFTSNQWKYKTIFKLFSFLSLSSTRSVNLCIENVPLITSTLFHGWGRNER